MRYLIALLLVLGLCSFALAEETSQANWNNDLGKFGDCLREKATGHSHAYELPDADRNIAYGAGIDLIVYEGPAEKEGLKKAIPDNVAIQTKYDFGNQEASGYLVATYKLNDLLKK
jgi:hypothetical protein